MAVSDACSPVGTFEAARHTAEHVPGARFVGYPTGGHLWVGRHEEVMSEIKRFLRDVEARVHGALPTL